MPELSLLTESPSATQQTLGPDNMPVKDIATDLSTIKLRDVSVPKLGKEAAIGLMDFTERAGTDFTITSAMRDDDGHSHHGIGNAIDFGVQEKDGRGMIDFFFDDKEGTKLSEKGNQYLIDHNAELIDERSNEGGGAHFHLEFNNPNGASFIDKDGEQALYPKDKLADDKYPIYGVQDSYKENPFNLSKDYDKAYNELLQEGQDSVDIGPDSEFMKRFGSSSRQNEMVEADSPREGIDLSTVKPVVGEEGFTPYKGDDIDVYSAERKPITFSKSKDGEWQSKWLSHPSEVDIREEYRNRGVQMFKGQNLEEAAGLRQSNWNKIGRGLGTMATSFLQVGTSTLSSIVIGIPSAIITGKFRNFYANPVNTAIEEYVKWYGETYPHHATEAQKDRVLNPNFWTQQLPQGIGFLAGAAVTGGIGAQLKIGGGIYKALSGAKNIVRANAAAFRARGLTFMQSKRALDIIGKTATKSQAANFAGAGIISAIGEASIEANSIYHQSIANMEEMKRKGDPRFKDMSQEEIENAAASYSNVAWLANVAIVGSSNMLMFKNLFKSGYKDLSSRYLKGLVTREGAKVAMKKWATKPLYKKAKSAALRLKIPLTEMGEEWSQYALEKGAEDYFEYNYNPDSTGIASFLEGAVGMTQSAGRGIMQTPTEVEGKQSMLLGFMLGGLGSVSSSIKGTSERQQWEAQFESTKALVETVNAYAEGSDLHKHITALARMEKAELDQVRAIENQDILLSKSQEASKIFHMMELYSELGQLDAFEELLNDVSKLDNETFGKTFELAGYENEDQKNAESEEAREVVPISKADVNKQIEGIKRRLNFFKDSANTVNAAVDGVIQKIIANYKGDPAELKLKLPYLRGLLKYYSWMAKDFDQREAELKGELSQMSDGAVNTDTIFTELLKDAGIDVDSDAMSEEVFLQGLTKEELEEYMNPKDLFSAKEIEDKYGYTPGVYDRSFWGKAVKQYEEQVAEWDKQDMAPSPVDKANAAQKFRDALILNIQKKQFNNLVNGVLDDPNGVLSKVKVAEENPAVKEAETVQEIVNDEAKSQEELEQELANQNANQEDPPPPVGPPPSLTPGAQDLADEAGITDFSMIDGTGKDGKITKRDIQKYIKDKATVASAPKSRNIKDIVEQLINQKNNLEFAVDPKDGKTKYRNKKTGKFYERVTGILDDKVVEQNDTLKSASTIGTKVDELVRDFFSDSLKPVSEYAKDIVSIQNGEQVIEEFLQTLREMKQGFDERGETVLANDIILYDDVQGVAGTVDLLTYDSAGNFRIYDMKTMKGNQFTTFYPGQNKPKYDSGFDGGLSNRVKHQRQLSLYRILLNNTNGVLAPDLGIIAIEVQYSPGETKTSKLQYIKSEPVTALDEVPTPGHPTLQSVKLDESKTQGVVNIPNTSTSQNQKTINNAADPLEAPLNNTDSKSEDLSNQIGNKEAVGDDQKTYAIPTLLKAAWKSFRNAWKNQRGKDQETSDYLEDPDTGSTVGKDVIFDFDLDYMGKFSATEKLAQKIKNKEKLTDKELDQLAIRATIQGTGNKKVVVYVHLPSFGNKVDPDVREEKIQELREYRRNIYETYLKGERPTAKITYHSGGHIKDQLRFDKSGAPAQLNVSTVVNRGNPASRKTKVILSVNKNRKFTDENGNPTQGLETYRGTKEANGAIYTIIKMANGQSFPLRLFVNKLNTEMATFITEIYSLAAQGELKLNRPVQPEILDVLDGLGKVGKSFADFLRTKKTMPTYGQVINMLTYEASDITPPFKFDFKTKTLTIGNKAIPFAELESSKDEVIEWLTENKRFNVDMSQVNGAGNYNNWLVENKIIFTNAFVNIESGSAFTQPTLQFGPLSKSPRKPLPKPKTKQEPSGKKESKKPNKPKKSNMFTNMMNQGIPEDLIEDMVEDMQENVVEESSTTNMFEGLETSTDMSDLLEEMKAAEENVENTESEGELDLSLFENYQGASDNINNKTEDNPEDKSNKNEFKDKC